MQFIVIFSGKALRQECLCFLLLEVSTSTRPTVMILLIVALKWSQWSLGFSATRVSAGLELFEKQGRGRLHSLQLALCTV